MNRLLPAPTPQDIEAALAAIRDGTSACGRCARLDQHMDTYHQAVAEGDRSGGSPSLIPMAWIWAAMAVVPVQPRRWRSPGSTHASPLGGRDQTSAIRTMPKYRGTCLMAGSSNCTIAEERPRTWAPALREVTSSIRSDKRGPLMQLTWLRNLKLLGLNFDRNLGQETSVSDRCRLETQSRRDKRVE
jgi:hypothetical protein